MSGMLIPIAVSSGSTTGTSPRSSGGRPLTLIILGVATSVSRSAIISLVVAFAVLVVLLPPVPRLAALCAAAVRAGGTSCRRTG